MPPRFPHGLKRNPIHMSTSEKAVFAMLGTSVVAGILHLAASPFWAKQDSSAVDDTSSEGGDSGKPKPYIFQL